MWTIDHACLVQSINALLDLCLTWLKSLAFWLNSLRCNLVHSECIAELFGHRFAVFGVKDHFFRLVARYDLHHSCCKLLGTFELLILFVLVLTFESLKYFLLKSFLL